MPEPAAESLSIIIANHIAKVAAQTTLDLEGLITMMKASGMTNEAIKKALIADLRDGGRLFGTFRNQVKNTVRTGITMSANKAALAVFKELNIKNYIWITVSKNPCPDCKRRAGEVHSIEFWENVGLPASGFSVCQEHCKCKLQPSNYKGDTTLLR